MKGKEGKMRKKKELGSERERGRKERSDADYTQTQRDDEDAVSAYHSKNTTLT